MNYELAKELKDAGFPQIPQHTFLYERDENGKEVVDDSVTVPNLSQLIEVCGEGFGSLDKGIDIWLAFPSGIRNDSNGKTPEEAVAKLWLALNKK